MAMGCGGVKYHIVYEQHRYVLIWCHCSSQFVTIEERCELIEDPAPFGEGETKGCTRL